MSDASGPMSWSEFAAHPQPSGAERIRWGAGPREFGLLRTPPGAGPHPVAVLVHGGCWSSEAGPDYLGRLAVWIVEQGWATWSLAFPRTDDPGGGWPGTLRAVGRAADHLREIPVSAALDTARVVAVGHSSGGHLALWLASRPALPAEGEGGRIRGPDPLALRGVIGLAPIGSLAVFHAEGGHGCDDDAVEALLGGPPEAHPGRLAVADPAGRLPLGVPQLLVAGALDETVPPTHTADFARRARAAGGRIEYLEIEGAGHFEVVAPSWSDWPRVAVPVARFLRMCRAGRDGEEGEGREQG
jgi:acetyl esterase/lipase